MYVLFFFFKQKTAYEMCGRDWSSDVCSSDLYSYFFDPQLSVSKFRSPAFASHVSFLSSFVSPLSSCVSSRIYPPPMNLMSQSCRCP